MPSTISKNKKKKRSFDKIKFIHFKKNGKFHPQVLKNLQKINVELWKHKPKIDDECLTQRKFRILIGEPAKGLACVANVQRSGSTLLKTINTQGTKMLYELIIKSWFIANRGRSKQTITKEDVKIAARTMNFIIL